MDEISVDDISDYVFSSKYHFQRVFHLITGVTVGEYIRNRRLSLAGRDLQHTDSKVVDIALKYRYETSESFSKAFSRFHGITPSEVRTLGSGSRLKFFYPLVIHVSVQGGFDTARLLIDQFCWNSMEEVSRAWSDSENYHRIISWAGKARGQNPGVFDALTEWLLDDSEWSDDKLAENEQILMQGVLARFREQNAQLRDCLEELRPSGVVNEAVFRALDHFDEGLAGRLCDERLQTVVSEVFADFSIMSSHRVREQIAGSKTGPAGIGHADPYGYINHLKDCDAKVQWTLFMPDKVKGQQDGIQVVQFEYMEMPAIRFIGKPGDPLADMEKRKAIFRRLDGLSSFRSGFDYDMLLEHHGGLSIDVEPCHEYWGRFMKAGTPVPEGFIGLDFVPHDDGGVGAPFISQFAYAVFSGDLEAMHRYEGYDRGAMYDITRNIMLGQGVTIPYPEKYWTAEVFLNGYKRCSTACLFGAKLQQNGAKRKDRDSWEM